MEAESKYTTIVFGETDISTLVSKIAESGGDLKYKSSIGFGNITDTVQIGGTNWEVSLDIRLNSTTLQDFLTTGSDLLTITYIAGPKDTPTKLLTYEYENAYPKVVSGGMEEAGYFKGTITFIIPYYDNEGVINRTVSVSGA